MSTKKQQLEMIIHAMKGASAGIAAAMEEESITPEQVQYLLLSLISQLENTQLNHSHVTE